MSLIPEAALVHLEEKSVDFHHKPWIILTLSISQNKTQAAVD